MRVRSALSLALMALLVSACGGGGGGSSSPTGVTVPPPIDSGVTNQSVQLADTQSALIGVEGYDTYGSGGASALAVPRAVRRMLRGANAKAIFAHERSAATCELGAGGGGEEMTIVAGSGGSEVVTIETFYDLECTEPETDLVWTASAQGYNLTGPATFTGYAQSGTVSETADAQITFYGNSSEQLTGLSFLLTDIVVSGTAVGSVGIACTETGAETCSIAVVSDGGGTPTGAVADISVTNATTESLSMQIASYAGSGLAIAAGTPFPDWTITPSTQQTGSVSLSGSSNSSGGFTLTLTDTGNGGTYTIDGSASGTVTGTLSATGSGTTEASFNVDASGNGTMTYANGTTAPIVEYIVK